MEEECRTVLTAAPTSNHTGFSATFPSSCLRISILNRSRYFASNCITATATHKCSRGGLNIAINLLQGLADPVRQISIRKSGSTPARYRFRTRILSALEISGANQHSARGAGNLTTFKFHLGLPRWQATPWTPPKAVWWCDRPSRLDTWLFAITFSLRS